MAATFLTPKNNAKTTLAALLSNVATTIAVTDGSVFPLTVDCPFNATDDSEILHVTANAANNLTFTRGAEGTTPAEHASGSKIELRITAGAIEEIHTAINTLEGGSASGLVLDSEVGDSEWSGITTLGDAATELNIGDLCYLDNNGFWNLADADEVNYSGDCMLGICLTYAAAYPDDINILLYGFIQMAAYNFTNRSDAIYVSCTAGAMTQTKPSGAGDIVRCVGHCYNHLDRLLFDPDGRYDVVANEISLNDLHDVTAAAPSDNDVLRFNTSSGNWESEVE